MFAVRSSNQPKGLSKFFDPGRSRDYGAYGSDHPLTPVPKSGDMHLVNNFRPVSVIPVLAKVFETVVHRQLYEYFESHGLLNPAQSGFRPFHNTQDVILKTIDDWKLPIYV